MFMHGSKMASLHKHLDPKHLPADYGGSRPRIDYSSANWYHTLAAIDPHLKGIVTESIVIVVFID